MRPVTSATTVPARVTAAPGLLIAAILLLALNMRGPIVAVSPVTEVIRADLGVDAGTVGLLTSLPVLCFGLATPPASALLARLGLGRGVLVALAVLLAGIVVRSLGGLTAALAGTVLIGAAITVANVAVPVVIGRELADRTGPVLGAYTAALNVGSMLTLSLTVPIADATGWQLALAVWGVLVVVAAVIWWWTTRPLADGPAAVAPPAEGVDAGPPWWRRPVVWGLTVAFSGQAFAYYGMTAWLPVLLGDRLGMTPAQAGVSASIFQVAALAGAVGVPVLLRWCSGPRTAMAVVCGAWLVMLLGLLFVPAGWAVWCVFGGAAQGGGLTVIFALVVRKARDAAENRRMSALVQGGGYTVAATGPFVVGAVHEASGGWTAPLAVVIASVLVLTVAGLLSSRERATRPG
jgi:CP family cyanate transporter-like MFS transporter